MNRTRYRIGRQVAYRPTDSEADSATVARGSVMIGNVTALGGSGLLTVTVGATSYASRNHGGGKGQFSFATGGSAP